MLLGLDLLTRLDHEIMKLSDFFFGGGGIFKI
jgi:hypothetical protein